MSDTNPCDQPAYIDQPAQAHALAPERTITQPPKGLSFFFTFSIKVFDIISINKSTFYLLRQLGKMGCGASADLSRNGAVAAGQGSPAPVIHPLQSIAPGEQGMFGSI
jgi:hypothetical protein